MEYEIDFERIYNSSPDMCISLDIETGKVVTFNQTLLDVLGYTKEECLTMPLLNFYHPDYHNKVKENFTSLSKNGIVIHTELELLKKNGDTIEVLLQFTTIKNTNGKRSYSNAVWRDISDIKEIERELRKEKAKVEIQNILIEEKNKDILASINYAKRIQTAILPSVNKIKEHLKESFVLYKPKDIVSGDFYWMEATGNCLLIAAADCTGHGVPGALVSILCNAALNSSVREFGILDPGKILDKTRALIIQEFEKSEKVVTDGMDISLCKLEGNLLSYAGANNPLWLIRDGKLIETKADKQTVGQSTYSKPFTTHSMKVEKGDTIYMFSDGFQDQFGGKHRINGKKYMSKKFKLFLLSIQNFSMEDQHKLINDEFINWKGTLEQVDDLCVVGIRI
jgi:PAS domain S-box-containing protein